MYDFLTPDDIAECIMVLLSRNKIFSGKIIHASFIVNMVAGCFTNNKKSQKYKTLFNSIYKEYKFFPSCAVSYDYKIFHTEYCGHAKELAESVVTQQIASDKDNTEYLIVTAGGDGTSLEVQTALYKTAISSPQKKDAILNKITVLRLPLGTGNDGTDGHCIEELLELLKGPLIFSNERAIKIYPQNEVSSENLFVAKKNPYKYFDKDFLPPWYAFNIASIGLDAYVVYMTNRIKNKLPGNFYHFCVPISGFIYNKAFPIGNAKVSLYKNSNDSSPEEILEAPITLLAFGVSGYRVYGGGHKILPNFHNLCFAPKISLPRLIANNKRIVNGTFESTKIASLHSADKIIIEYDKPVLLQCDGEVALLCKEHFPLVMEKTDPCLRTLKSHL